MVCQRAELQIDPLFPTRQRSTGLAASFFVSEKPTVRVPPSPAPSQSVCRFLFHSPPSKTINMARFVIPPQLKTPETLLVSKNNQQQPPVVLPLLQTILPT